MQNVIIRRAQKKDCPGLLELIKGLATYVNAPQEVTISVEHLEENGFGEKPIWWAFVAETKGVIYGFALYYIRFSTWKGKKMELEDLFVAEEMRGNGIGKLLFDQLIIEAKEKEFKEIVWQVLERNKPAIDFYKKYHAQFNSDRINCSLEISR